MKGFAAIVTFAILRGFFAIDDGSNLVQAFLHLHEAADNCTCVPWKNAYEFCEMYFRKLPEASFCQKTNFGPEHDVAWCYVPKDCFRSRALPLMPRARILLSGTPG